MDAGTADSLLQHGPKIPLILVLINRCLLPGTYLDLIHRQNSSGSYHHGEDFLIQLKGTHVLLKGERAVDFALLPFDMCIFIHHTRSSVIKRSVPQQCGISYSSTTQQWAQKQHTSVLIFLD